MIFPFTKMHGLGNDFVVFDFTQQSFVMSAGKAAQIADRRFGIGCDQILIVEYSPRADIDFTYRIINADGREVGQCGNGARCFATFVREQGLTDKTTISVATLSGDMQLRVDETSGLVTVAMGLPHFEPDQIPLDWNQRQATYEVNIAEEIVNFAALSIGNPHAIVTVNEIDDGTLERLGSALESHRLFPQQANIGFMQIIDHNNINLRVYERGAGETKACGSGACAAVVSGIVSGLLDDQVTVHLTGGDLSIAWRGEGHPVLMTGSTETVFTGEIIIEKG